MHYKGSASPEKLYVDLADLQEDGSICERVVAFRSKRGDQEKKMMKRV